MTAEEMEKEFGTGLSSDGSTHEDDIYFTEEITVEEMAIDGICGVY